MIEIKNITKKYGKTRAVNNVTLKIHKGELFGLIGPDGAGKTTLFRMITTLLVPDAGKISVRGLDTISEYREIRQFTGYMPGRFSLYPDLTVGENLSFYATIFGTSVEKNYGLIRNVFSFLKPFESRLARNLSGGMKQKLALCCALIHNPQLLVLDEPTTGVDAVSRKEFWDTLNDLKDTGMTILVSTPYMDEASRCDRVALIQGGKIIDENTPSSILSSFSFPLYGIKTTNRSETIGKLRSLEGVRRAYLFGHSVHASLEPGLDAHWLKDKMTRSGVSDIQITVIKPDFEDCFIEAVQRESSRSSSSS